MTHEGGPRPISQSELAFRNKARFVLNPIFRGEVADRTETGLYGLAELRARTGMGAILYANHIDKVDPLVAMLQVVRNHPALESAEIVTPLAHHQRMDGIHLVGLSRRAGVYPMTIVTQNSRERYEEKAVKKARARKIGPITLRPGQEVDLSTLPKLGSGGIEFAQKATESLATGGLVYLPAQAERSGKLRLPDEKITNDPDERRKERPLGLLVAALEEQQLPLDKIGLLPVGFSFRNNPSYEKKRGFNFGSTHIVRFGDFMTVQDAVNAAGGKKRLDEWAIVHGLAPVVDRNYLSPKVRGEHEASIVAKMIKQWEKTTES